MFVEFQFSLGLDPNFAIPIPLDMPPPPTMTEDELLSFEPIPAPMNNTVLNENDQKAFSQFLHEFYIDPNMQIDPQFSSVFEAENRLLQPSSIPYVNYQPHYHNAPIYNTTNHEHEEHHRQSSILQSLDAQKKFFQKEQVAEKPVYLQQSNAVSAPYIKSSSSSSVKSTVARKDCYEQKTTMIGGGAIRRNKPHKELLTEEEKRNNHIASEQKRRSMIRTGFKDLTEIVPTLKNINNSKSTVLFKAVDYIKYLEKRNKNLREKIRNLEVRVEVEGKIDTLNSKPQVMLTNNMNAALLQHKTQQKQLIELQERLQLHQKQQQFGRIHEEERFLYSQKWQANNEKDLSEDVVSSTGTNESSLIKATVSA